MLPACQAHPQRRRSGGGGRRIWGGAGAPALRDALVRRAGAAVSRAFVVCVLFVSIWAKHSTLLATLSTGVAGCSRFVLFRIY